MTDVGQNIDVQIEDTSEEDGVLPYRYTITSYGADYPVDGLVKRLETDDIFVPHFQRRYVWNLSQASKFVESLLLGLPVPGIFLGKQDRTNRFLVIDGQQRLLTLKFFFDGIFSTSTKQFSLKGVEKYLEGLTYKTLGDEQRRMLDNSIIHATIVRQDEPSDNDSSIYLVFERINTGGTPLSPQEIRTCVSYGRFVEFLGELNKINEWRDLVGPINARRKDEELILRFFALLEQQESYERPMKAFLNDYIAHNYELANSKEHKLRNIFESTIGFLHKTVGQKVFRPKAAVNAAIVDAVMIGTWRRLERGEVLNTSAFCEAYKQLIVNTEFIPAYTKSTADQPQIFSRVKLATAAFAAIE